MSTDPLASLERPGGRRLAVRVTAAGERALRRGHPWLFDGAIERVSPEGRVGDLAVAFDRRRRFLAIGLYDPSSPIRVRVLAHAEPVPIDEAFLATRLRAAADLRRPLAGTDTTGYRLVHGENDRLPGLVLDRYDDTLVLKLYTPAWGPWLEVLASCLPTVVPHERLVLRWSRAALGATAAPWRLLDGTVLRGPALAGPVPFRENGMHLEADVRRGQKTGFFFDQRENRARLRRLSAGRTVLDVFAYTGGFSLAAAFGGAKEAWSVDASAPALEAARRNFARNREAPSVAACRHRVLVLDAFDGLSRLARDGPTFDLVVVDPPAMAKREDEVRPALGAYRRLVELALAVLAPGGILAMASCSSRVPANAFFDTVLRTAAQAGRGLQTIERTGHPLDHPVGFPEGAYLKCLFATAP